MARLIFTVLLVASGAATMGRSPQVTASAPSAATGARWVVVRAPGLTCPSCADELKTSLTAVPGLSQIETFPDAPYCRFHVDAEQLDVQALIDHLATKHPALDGWSFVRGG